MNKVEPGTKGIVYPRRLIAIPSSIVDNPSSSSTAPPAKNSSIWQELRSLLKSSGLIDENSETRFIDFFWEKIGSDSLFGIHTFLHDTIKLPSEELGMEIEYRRKDLFDFLIEEGLIDIDTLEMYGRDVLKRAGLDYFLQIIAPYLRMPFEKLRDCLKSSLGEEAFAKAKEEFEEANDTDLCVQIKMDEEEIRSKKLWERERMQNGPREAPWVRKSKGFLLPLVEQKVIAFFEKRIDCLSREKCEEVISILQKRHPTHKAYQSLTPDSPNVLAVIVQKFLIRTTPYFDGKTHCCLFEIGSMDLTIYDCMDSYSDFTCRSLRLRLSPFFRKEAEAEIIPYTDHPDDPQVIVDILTNFIRPMNDSAISKEWINFISQITRGGFSSRAEHAKYLRKFIKTSYPFTALTTKNLRKHHQKRPHALLAFLWNARLSIELLQEEEKKDALLEEIKRLFDKRFVENECDEAPLPTIIKGHFGQGLPFALSCALASLFAFWIQEGSEDNFSDLERMEIASEKLSSYIHAIRPDAFWEALLLELSSVKNIAHRMLAAKILKAIFLSKKGAAAVSESEAMPFLKSENALAYLCGLYFLCASARAPSQEASDMALKHAFLLSEIPEERSPSLAGLEKLLRGAPYFLKPEGLTGLQAKTEDEPQKMWALSLAGSSNASLQRIAFLVFKEAAAEKEEMDPLTAKIGSLLLMGQGSVEIWTNTILLLFKHNKLSYQDALRQADSACQAKDFALSKSFEKLLSALVKKCPQGKIKLPALKSNGAFVAKALAESEDMKLLQTFIKCPLMALISDADSLIALYEKACLQNLSAEISNPLEALELWLAAHRKNLWHKSQKGRASCSGLALKLIPLLRAHSPESLQLLLEPLAKIQIPKENQKELGRLVFDCRIAYHPSNVQEVSADRFLSSEQKDELKLHILEAAFAEDPKKAFAIAVQVFKDELAPALRLRFQAILIKIADASMEQQVSLENVHLISCLLINRKVEALLEDSYLKMLLKLFQLQLSEAGEIQGKRLDLAALLMEKLKKLPLKSNGPLIAEASLTLLAWLNSYWLPETGRHASLKKQITELTPKMFASLLDSGEIIGAFRLMQKMAVCKIPFEEKGCSEIFKELILQGLSSKEIAVQEHALECLRAIYVQRILELLDRQPNIDFLKNLAGSLIKLKMYGEAACCLGQIDNLDTGHFSSEVQCGLLFDFLRALEEDKQESLLISFYCEWVEGKRGRKADQWKTFWNACLSGLELGKSGEAKRLLTAMPKEEMDEENLERLVHFLKEAPNPSQNADLLLFLSSLEKNVVSDSWAVEKLYSDASIFEQFQAVDRACSLFIAMARQGKFQDRLRIRTVCIGFVKVPSLSFHTLMRMLKDDSIFDALSNDVEASEENPYAEILPECTRRWRPALASFEEASSLFTLRRSADAQILAKMREDELDFLEKISQERDPEICSSALIFCSDLLSTGERFPLKRQNSIEQSLLRILGSLYQAKKLLEEMEFVHIAADLRILCPTPKVMLRFIMLLNLYPGRKSYFEMMRCFLVMASFAHAFDKEFLQKLKESLPVLNGLFSRFAASTSIAVTDAVLKFLSHRQIKPVIDSSCSLPILRKLIQRKLSSFFKHDDCMKDNGSLMLFFQNFDVFQKEPFALKRYTVRAISLLFSVPLTDSEEQVFYSWKVALFEYAQSQMECRKYQKEKKISPGEGLLRSICTAILKRLILQANRLEKPERADILLRFLNETLIILFAQTKRKDRGLSDIFKDYLFLLLTAEAIFRKIEYNNIGVLLANAMLVKEFYNAFNIEALICEHLAKLVLPELSLTVPPLIWQYLKVTLKKEVVEAVTGKLLGLNNFSSLRAAILYLRENQHFFFKEEMKFIDGLYSQILHLADGKAEVDQLNFETYKNCVTDISSKSLRSFFMAMDKRYLTLSKASFDYYKSFPLIKEPGTVRDSVSKMRSTLKISCSLLVHLTKRKDVDFKSLRAYALLLSLNTRTFVMWRQSVPRKYLADDEEAALELFLEVYDIFQNEPFKDSYPELTKDYFTPLFHCPFSNEALLRRIWEFAEKESLNSRDHFNCDALVDRLYLSEILLAIRDNDLAAIKAKEAGLQKIRIDSLNPLQIACLYDANEIIDWTVQSHPQMVACRTNLKEIKRFARQHFPEELQGIPEENERKALLDLRRRHAKEFEPLLSLSPLALACLRGNIIALTLILQNMKTMPRAQFADTLKMICCFQEPNELFTIAALRLILNQTGAEAVLSVCENFLFPNGKLIHEVVLMRKYQALRLLLENGAHVNELNIDLNTPLHLICLKKSLDEKDAIMILILLEKKAWLNLRNKDNKTPLHIACENGHDKILKHLIFTELQFNREHLLNGAGLFNFAALGGSLAVFEELKSILKEKFSLSDSEIVELYNSKDNLGENSLTIAVRQRNLPVAHHLLSDGADPFVRDGEGNTLLDIATLQGHTEIAELIFSIFTCPTFIESDDDLLSSQNFTGSVLHHACSGNKRLAKRYINYGMPLQSLDDKGMTPLHHAVFNSKMEIVLMILEAARKRNMLGIIVNAKDAQQRTPLHYAAFNNSGDCVRILLENGADKEAEDLEQKTPLQAAAAGKFENIVNLLK